MKEKLTKEKVILFIRQQWKPLTFGGVIVLILIVTLSLPGDRNAAGKGSIGTSQPINKPRGPLGFLAGDKKEPTPTPVNTRAAIEKSLTNIHSGNPQAPIPTGIIQILPNGTRTVQNVGGSSVIQTTQGTINTQANIQTGVTSSTQVDNIRVVFRNPDGSTTTYIPPGTPPNEVRWGRYTNNRYKYAINYPSNWRFFYTIDADGHEGIALYPPYVDANDPNSPYVGFGLTERFLLPASGDTSNALITTIKADGVDGELYTDGPLGSSYMASTFRYNDKYFGLGASISDATFAYVYYYMLYSLTFNVP